MGAITQWITSPARLPKYLQQQMGRAFVSTFGGVGDEFRAACTFLFRESMLETCTPDALPAHLVNSNFLVITGEAVAATLAYLRLRWQQSRESGGVEGIERALARLGFTNTAVWSALDLQLAGVSTPFGGYQGFFFVIINQPNPWSRGDTWAGGAKWGDTSRATPPGPPLWGLGGSRVLLQQTIAQVQKFKHGCSSCRFLVLALDSTFAFNPTGTPPFTGNFVIIPVWEWWESRVTGNGYPNEFYNLSFLVP